VFLRQNLLQHAVAQFEAGLNAASALPAPDWDAAIVGLREAGSHGIPSPEVHNIIGLILGRKGSDTSQVVAEFKEALRLRPEYAEAHNNIGLILAQNGDDEKASNEFREAVRIRPDYDDAHAIWVPCSCSPTWIKPSASWRKRSPSIQRSSKPSSTLPKRMATVPVTECETDRAIAEDHFHCAGFCSGAPGVRQGNAA
jgi:hypothetical protein